jgi:MYXO-CTERM domain-containing protein
MAWADTCPDYGEAVVTGSVDLAGLEESSGVAASRVRPGVFYTHVDGGEPRLFAFRADGTALQTLAVTGAEVEDWEDLAAAPCPDKGDCLYIGDIGDNAAARASITVYVVREPDEGDDKAPVRERYTAVYPDGPADAEAMWVHPCTGRIHVVTKADDGLSTVYRFPVPGELGRDTVTLEQVARVQVDGPTAEARRVTGGDVDLDGDRVVLRTPTQVLEWVADPERPNAHWSEAPRVLAAASVSQGEGVAFTLEGGLITTAEGRPMEVATFDCAPVAADHACDFPQQGCGCSHGGGAGWWLLGLAGVLIRRRR